jgi:hypothetical protein
MRALFAALGLTVMLAAPAFAGDEVKVRTGADGRKVYVAPPVIVRGKTQRPEVQFFMPRAKISYEWPELRRDPPPTPDPDTPPAR